MYSNVLLAPRQRKTVWQQHISIPTSPLSTGRSVITEVLGGELKFEFFHRWFNSLFLASVALTLLLLYGCACSLRLISGHLQIPQHLCITVLQLAVLWPPGYSSYVLIGMQPVTRNLVLRRKYQHSLDEGPPDLPLYAAHHTKA
jgi:Abscisic acid G-protein coupled receptor